MPYVPLDAAGTSTCIKQANDKGIKVICIFACTSQGKSDLTVTIDVLADGKQIGTWMGKAVGSGEVGFLDAPPGDEGAQGFGRGFKAGLAESCPGCNLVVDVGGGHDRDTGYTISLEALTAHPNIKGMYGLNDDVAMGILRAIQQLGRAGKIKVAGHNGTCEALASILKGDLGFTMLFAGEPFGINTVDAALKLHAGQTVAAANVTSIPLDQATAKGILDGSIPNPTGVDVKARLQKAQSGCQ
ncbi:MAG: sugar ABC transporter substrate-binding protein [Candidatus Dormibacteraeota bacterium]|nr:sugar ABC transporter substrate-binding protein [Candidatus Dormibacteraeota bacterium]